MTLLDHVRIGTSGYSFRGWVGTFYPRGIKSSDFLEYYAMHFDTVEINTTYYGIPKPQVLENMEKKTPANFHFVVKLNQAMTHEGSRDPQLYREFLGVLDPLKSARKYDGLLAQFAWGFQRTPENQQHLVAMRELLGDEPLHVEFRHASWAATDVAPWLREHRLGYCVVDEPRLHGLMPAQTLVTSDDAYVRFHGRNAATWWGRGGGDRYDYDYKPHELEEWILKIQELAQQARRTYLFFNNCHAGQAARNAKLMQELMRQQETV